MMLDESMRHRLHGRLADVLGDEEAAALMSALPVSELATKADLELLAARLRVEMGELRSELREGLAEQRAWIADELRTAIAGQTRQVFFGMIGVVATFGGLLLASAHIH